jgi:hypothetical protein
LFESRLACSSANFDKFIFSFSGRIKTRNHHRIETLKKLLNMTQKVSVNYNPQILSSMFIIYGPHNYGFLEYDAV